MTAPTRLMTLDEFLRLPETKPYTELIDGVAERKPVGKRKHSKAQWRLARLLDRHPATAAGAPWPELGFRFPRSSRGNLRVPDVSYYLSGSDDSDDGDDYPEKAPDLAAEVRSPGQSMASLRDRLAFLREQGTRCTLLIDPEAQIVEVHDGEQDWTANLSDTVSLARLDGFSSAVRELFE